MSVVECVGLKPPARVDVRVTSSDVTFLVAKANERAMFRAYASRADSWGKGLIRKMSGGYLSLSTIPAVNGATSIVAGLGGEHAVREYLCSKLNRRYAIDVELKECGDGGTDILAKPVRIDVKARIQPIPINRVRVESETGRRLPPKCDALVFCEWSSPDVISVLGWADVESMSGWTVERAPAGHVNIVAADEQLLPMNRLVSLIKGLE